MSRTAVYTALILRSRPSGESNREVYLLTAEQGIIRATVFGGPKSRLRAYASPYHSGRVWLYHNPVKDSTKLSDFDVHSWRPGLRELFERTMAAGALADTVLSTHGGGGSQDAVSGQSALSLVTASLDALEDANEELCTRVFVHFLWRWAGFLGLRPHIGSCGSCGAAAGQTAPEGPLFFDAGEGTVLCTACLPAQHSGKNLLQLNAGCRKWLAAVTALEPSQLSRYSMDSRSFYEAKSLVAAILSGALGKRLASWDW